jgi:hypothetical protein
LSVWHLRASLDLVNRRADMASRGKKKTTAAKLNREGKLRQKRADKAMRKTRRLADADQRRDDEANGIFYDEDGQRIFLDENGERITPEPAEDEFVATAEERADL